MKKLFFKHDIDARNDLRIQNLIIEHGIAAYGLYWYIVELMYSNDGYLPKQQFKCIAYALHLEDEVVSAVLQSDLFRYSEEKDAYYSERILKELSHMQEVSETARKNINSRWSRYGGNTPVLRPYYDGNTDKDKEKKERIEETKKEINKETNKEEQKVIDQTIDWVNSYKPAFSDSVKRWLEYKMRRGASYSSAADARAFVNLLIRMSNSDPQKAADIIDTSIANNYLGLVPTNTKRNDGNNIRSKNPRDTRPEIIQYTGPEVPQANRYL